MRNKILNNNYKLLSRFYLIMLLVSCGITKNEENPNNYNEVAYVELNNNNDASLEVLNQLNFIGKQLERKKDGKFYSSYVVDNIITLSGISAEIDGLGTLGNSYKLTGETLNKWKSWYANNAEHITFEMIGNKKHIVVNYPNGKKTTLLVR